MFEHFTNRSREVIAMANQEAQRYNHEYIGCEHILLGLAKEPSGVAHAALAHLGAHYDRIRIAADEFLKCGPEMVVMGGKLPTTPRAKRVIQNSIEIACRMSSHVIGTEHILLALLDDKDSIAINILEHMNIKPAAVQDAVNAMLFPVREMQIDLCDRKTLQILRQTAIEMAGKTKDVLHSQMYMTLAAAADGLDAIEARNFFDALDKPML